MKRSGSCTIFPLPTASVPTMRAVLPLLAALAVTGPALAQRAVFVDASAQRSAMSAEQDRFLDAVHGYAGDPRLLTVDVEALDDEGSVTFALAGGDALTLRPDRVERHGKGRFSWFGSAEEGGRVVGQAIVTVRDGQAMGDFSTPTSAYALKPLGGGLHALVTLPDETPFESPALASRLSTLRDDHPAFPDAVGDAGSEPQRAGGPVYRVLFPYTAPAIGVVPDIALVAQQAIAYANQAYVNSQVNLRAEFAGLFQLDLPESGSLETDLRRLANPGDGFGDAVLAERNRVGADVVTLFRTADTTSTAGIAFVCTGQANAFGVFEIDGSGTGVVFTHEVGHIIGGGHEQSDAFGCNDFSRAKEHPNDLWRTVMYSSFSNQTTIPYFSNPNVSVEGEPTGTANARDNARTFNARAATVAAFRAGGLSTAVAEVIPAEPEVEVLVGEVSDVPYGTLFLRNSGGSNFQRWGLSSASPDFTFHTLGELVLGDLDDSGTELALEAGSCANDDALLEGFATFDFGFSFPFNGVAYTQARVSSNGYVVFDDYDGCSDDVPDRIPAPGGPDEYVSAFWSPDVRAVRSQSGQRTRVIVNTLDDGRVTVKWIGAGFFIPAPERRSFFFVDVQAIFGPDGSVEFRYDDLFRTLVGETDFELSDGTEIDVPLSRDIRVGIEYGPGDGTEVPFERLQSAGQVLFPNPALQLLDPTQIVVPGQTATVALRIDATRLPLGTFTLPLTLLTDAPNAPLLEIPIRVSVVTVLDGETASPSPFALEPIRPNPTSGLASLAFTLARPDRVEARVFDALGREVRLVDLGRLPAGPVETSIDTSGLAPGVYAVRLEAGGETRSRRVTVVR